MIRAFALFLALLLGCAHAPQSLAPAFAEVATVRITIPGGGHGSGFAIAPDVLATALHVVDTGVREIVTHQGETCTVLKVIASETDDVALVRVAGCTLHPLMIGGRVHLGETVYAAGHPLWLPQMITRGIVSNVDYDGQFLYDAPINPGMSGGPVLDVRGRVVGINVAIATMDGLWAGVSIAEPITDLQFLPRLEP